VVLLIIIIIVLSVFVGVLSTGALPSAKVVSQARFSDLALTQAWEATDEDHILNGCFAYNRTGQRLAWVSHGDLQFINFATCQAEVFRHLPGQQLNYDEAREISELCLDDSGYSLAVAWSSQTVTVANAVDLYRFDAPSESWLFEGSIQGTQKEHAFGVALQFDDKSRLLCTSKLPYGMYVYDFHSDVAEWQEAQFLSIGHKRERTSTTFYGNVLTSQRHIAVTSDPGAQGGKGEVYIIKRESGSDYGLYQTLTSSDQTLFSFGTQVTMDFLARRLFVSFGPREDRVDFYQRGVDQHFHHLQTINMNGLPRALTFPRFGSAMSCNEKYLAISAPGEFGDTFSSVFVYSFDDKSGEAKMPQQISNDGALLGFHVWLCPLLEKTKPFQSLTLLVTDENGGDFGRVLIYQSATMH